MRYYVSISVILYIKAKYNTYTNYTYWNWGKYIDQPMCSYTAAFENRPKGETYTCKNIEKF